MTPHEFKAKWSRPSGNERQTYQSHFNDLCDLLGVPKPSAADAADLTYTFEKQVTKAAGGTGAADVWKQGYFGWEYKAAERDLPGAYVQLLGYMNALENPPLLVVSDTKLIRIYPTFPNQKTVPIDIPIDAIDRPESRAILLRVFTEPMSFREEGTSEDVTRLAAERFGAIAGALQARGEDPHAVAHFLVQLLFCLFAEDVGILPRGLFGKVLAFGAKTPAQFTRAVDELLQVMGEGGYFWGEEIPHVNGGLFRDVRVIQLEQAELKTLADAAQLNWASVEPAIFGTLFERSLDPSSRAKLGAHYTGRPDILRVVEPVVMVPLRRRWEAVRDEAEGLHARWQALPRGKRWNDARDAFARVLTAFRDELAAVRILDPACGSGNFLYIALENLLELDNQVIAYGVERGLSGQLPQISPRQLLGLEVNEYARELAQVVIWIGYLQWMIGHGFGYRQPVLDPLETIRLQDALLDLSDPEHPREAAWPEADYIIGNPPFLGRQFQRRNLGDKTTTNLRRAFAGTLSRGCDLCCYFFEQARRQVERGVTYRVGMLANNSISQVDNREVLELIAANGAIFSADTNVPWTLAGADLRIAIVSFDNGDESARTLNGDAVDRIGPDLQIGSQSLSPIPLRENLELSFQGPIKVGKFDITGHEARRMLALPLNPNGRPNSDVIKPYFNAYSVIGRATDEWIIDFGTDMPEHEASLYEAPFEYLVAHVKEKRAANANKQRRTKWWIHGSPAANMRRAIENLNRYLVTPAVARHRVFVWLDCNDYPDHRLCVFARDDDYFFGVLQSSAHQVWSLRYSSRHGIGNDPTYNNTTCFQTFPLPWSPGQEPADDPDLVEIAASARDLYRLREAWLSPDGASEAELEKRTLTALYNVRPTWLANAHTQLDRAVWAAYGWPEDPGETSEDELLSRLLALNHERAAERSGVC